MKKIIVLVALMVNSCAYALYYPYADNYIHRQTQKASSVTANTWVYFTATKNIELIDIYVSMPGEVAFKLKNGTWSIPTTNPIPTFGLSKFERFPAKFYSMYAIRPVNVTADIVAVELENGAK